MAVATTIEQAVVGEHLCLSWTLPGPPLFWQRVGEVELVRMMMEKTAARLVTAATTAATHKPGVLLALVDKMEDQLVVALAVEEVATA